MAPKTLQHASAGRGARCRSARNEGLIDFLYLTEYKWCGRTFGDGSCNSDFLGEKLMGFNKPDVQLRTIKGRTVLVTKKKLPARTTARQIQTVREIKRDIAAVFGK